MRLVQSSSKNQSVDTFKRLQAFTCASRYIYRTRVSPILKQLGRYRRLLEVMIGFICILTLVQMILTAFSMLFGSWLQPVAAGTFFWTILLWLLVVLEEWTSGRPWTIF